MAPIDKTVPVNRRLWYASLKPMLLSEKSWYFKSVFCMIICMFGASKLCIQWLGKSFGTGYDAQVTHKFSFSTYPIFADFSTTYLKTRSFIPYIKHSHRNDIKNKYDRFKLRAVKRTFPMLLQEAIEAALKQTSLIYSKIAHSAWTDAL